MFFQKKKFSVCPLPSHLVPRIGKGHRKNKESVFVFTPLNFGGNEQKHKVNFQWVANDVSEVCLTLYNPLPIEVRLIGLALLHEGIEFENCPSTLSLAPNSGPHHASLLGKIYTRHIITFFTRCGKTRPEYIYLVHTYILP